jgi:hypothetical protein
MRRSVSVFLVLAACGGGGSAGSVDAGGGVADAAADAAPDAAPCTRTPAAADRVRHVVISHPYDADGNPASTWEVLDLAADGTLSRPGTTFEMGRATVGEVAFTPDGEIGLAVQDDDGSLGVFRLADDGTPTVIAAKLPASFYASRVVMAPSGDHAYVLAAQWRENGGGIYRVDIACDGTVTDRGLVAAAKLPAALACVPGTARAVVAATDLGSSAAGDDVHLVTWGEPPAYLGGSPSFGDDMAIVGGATLTADGQTFLVGDTSQFASVPNRVAIVTVGATGVSDPVVLPDIMDPIALVASPFGDVVLVASGFGNAFYVLDHGDVSWELRGEVSYQGAPPQLPGGAVRIDAGMLRGSVLVSENVGVRRVELRADGSVVDDGLFSLGSGLDAIVGAVGVTP